MSERIINRTGKGLALGALVIVVMIFLVGPRLLRGQGQLGARSSLSKWRPTQEYPGVGYVGSSTCAQCHTNEASTFIATSMAHALETPSRCEVLINHPRLTFRNGPYSYQITSQGGQSIYTVTDGAKKIS